MPPKPLRMDPVEALIAPLARMLATYDNPGDLAAAMAPHIRRVVFSCATNMLEGLEILSPEGLRAKIEAELEGGRMMAFDMEGGHTFTLRQATRKAYTMGLNAKVQRCCLLRSNRVWKTADTAIRDTGRACHSQQQSARRPPALQRPA